MKLERNVEVVKEIKTEIQELSSFSFNNNHSKTFKTKKITIIKDYYSQKYIDYKADFICCRQALEHIQEPYHFIKMIRRMIENQLKTVVFFEVPNILFTLQANGIWDLIYEHCNYFYHGSLKYLFSSCNFDVVKIWETYLGQYLCIEAVPIRKQNSQTSLLNKKEIKNLIIHADSFPEKYHQLIKTWKEQLKKITKT